MTRNEFSDMFDTLLNSHYTLADFGNEASRLEIALDEYEKSVLLTQALDIVVKTYFDRTLNTQGLGFDDTTRRLVDFSSLITVTSLSPVSLEGGESTSETFDDRGKLFKMPMRKLSGVYTDETADAENARHLIDDGNGRHPGDDEYVTTYPEDYTPVSKGQSWETTAEHTTDVLFILNEKMIVGTGSAARDYVIVPINYKEYDREMSKPFAQPLKKQAWRLFLNNTTGFDILTELIPKETLDLEGKEIKYKIRYVRRPVPIILELMPDDLTIDEMKGPSDCELNPILHMDILNKAVELAIVTRGYNARNVRETSEKA